MGWPLQRRTPAPSPPRTTQVKLDFLLRTRWPWLHGHVAHEVLVLIDARSPSFCRLTARVVCPTTCATWAPHPGEELVIKESFPRRGVARDDLVPVLIAKLEDAIGSRDWDAFRTIRP